MEFARYWRYHGLGGLDLMRAQFVRHRFARHSHETYAIGTLEAGQEEIRFADGVQYASADEVVMIEPGVVHTGEPHTTDGWAYRVLYPSVEQVREVADEIGVPGGTPSFERRVVADPRLSQRVAAAHRAAESGGSLAADTELHMLLTLVLAAYGTRRPQRQAHTVGRRSVAQVRDLLHATMPDPPSLAQLATVAGVSPYVLLRSFRRTYGMPPHAYVTQLRVAKARELLRQGMPPSQAAVTAGFCDQSHLSRHFRRLVGVPPRAYQRGVQ
ncbi:AraC family ligand binding domain-containing protein [Nonomuraea sp. 3N208]|uniref:AraC family ligand binding domain-containing protein n=1 Tax=Nonomuraea sp. 3N208 TaxID=3457421 RepID=UPI003FCCC8AC